MENVVMLKVSCLRLLVATTAGSLFLLIPAQTQELPAGDGKDLTEKACSTCHEINLVTAEKRSEAQWKAVVDDMVRRGADVSDAEKKTILAYLVRNFGK
jgi:hypothetical protein